MLEIGSLKLKSKFILAPMAGISDLTFRTLNRKFEAELAFVEMINCRSISYKSKRTHQMLVSNSKDRPLGLQLLGCEPKFILKALEVLKRYQFDVFDFNAACPAKKVVRRQEGAGLLKEPKKLNKLLKLLVKNSWVPVTVKIRTGWDEGSVNAREVALLAQEAGVSALFIHGRTKAQGYSGRVDYDTIRQVKGALQIPVIASGDIFSVELVKKMFDETGCDAVVIARGCLGNPWFFKKCRQFFENGKMPDNPQPDEIIMVMLWHLEDCVKLLGERIGVIRFRKFFSWYTKGFRQIRPLREKSSLVKTKRGMIEIIRQTKNPHFSGDFCR